MKGIQHVIKSLNAHPVRIIEPGSRAHAAVALILEKTPNGLSVLLIERSTNVNDSCSGDIAFPGGRREVCDSSLRDTAERETLEELGLDLSDAQYLGRLSDVTAGSLSIVVSCFVYLLKQHPVLHPDPHEVANAFWVPLSEINDPSQRCQVKFMSSKRAMKFPAVRLYHGKEKLLWGLTYRMLRNLNKALAGGKPY